ncbi:MAG: energy transducer TonB [Pyrinomonadaceae bacterium]
MKRCSACGEYLPGQFSFCPIDGKPVAEHNPATTYEYHLTLISERSLAGRLGIEAQFLFERTQQAWPQFRAEPLAFTRFQLVRLASSFKRTIARPYVATASVMAIVVVLLVGLSAVLLESRGRSAALVEEANEELVPTTMIDFQNDQKPDSKPGVGAGKGGRVGFNKGRGEGSGPKPARAQGGGGGGDLSQLTQSQGRLPVPSVIPAPIPTTYARLPQSMPLAGINIDPVLWKDLPFRDYGDPRSKSTTASNGPGKDGGVGTGEGPGIGEGNGTGFGPGNKNNMGGRDGKPGCCGSGGSSGNNPNLDVDRVYRVSEVTTRARVLSKPEPQYTEEARKSQITGTVILSVVFSRTGEVTNIRAVQPLCCGLTEKAISAARQIRFIPATREGQGVSTRMQLEYNFNLY